MLEGLPSLFRYLIDGVAIERRCGSLEIVVYHLLGDVVNAAKHALIHYLPLTLDEEFLQHSSIGTPYQKWAKFTNEDFQDLDNCLRRLVPAVWNWYHQPFDQSHRDPRSIKGVWRWFNAIKTDYVACVVNPSEPSLTTSALGMDAWVEPTHRELLRFENDLGQDKGESSAPIVTRMTYDISDRSVLAELQRAGLARLGELEALNAQFATWLQAHCTMQDIVAPHSGTLCEGSLG